MSPDVVHLGVDVSKDSLDIAFLSESFSVPNTAAGLRQLLRRIAKHPAAVHVVCEATDGYERLLADAMHRAAVTISVVNPRLVRDFARTKNRLAKTDRIAAAMLAQYGAVMGPQPTPQPDPATQRLGLLVGQRDSLVEERASQDTPFADHRALPAGRRAPRHRMPERRDHQDRGAHAQNGRRQRRAG